MNQSTLSQGESWMTPEERHLNHQFVQSTTQHLATRGVPENPLILLRINDVIVTWLLARRLESALTPEPGEPAPCPTIAQAGAIGKCRDRLRRAMKELEACCPSGATPIGIALPQQQHRSAQQPTAPAPQAKQINQHELPANETETKADTSTQTPAQPPTTVEYPSQNTEETESTPTSPFPARETETEANTTTPTPIQPPAPPPRRQKPTKKPRKKRGRPIRR